jgi:hypothetical protein
MPRPWHCLTGLAYLQIMNDAVQTVTARFVLFAEECRL